MCRTSRKSGALTYRISHGPVQACSGTVLQVVETALFWMLETEDCFHIVSLMIQMVRSAQRSKLRFWFVSEGCQCLKIYSSAEVLDSEDNKSDIVTWLLRYPAQRLMVWWLMNDGLERLRRERLWSSLRYCWVGGEPRATSGCPACL
jgi:hypothetical protein